VFREIELIDLNAFILRQINAVNVPSVNSQVCGTPNNAYLQLRRLPANDEYANAARMLDQGMAKRPEDGGKRAIDEDRKKTATNGVRGNDI